MATTQRESNFELLRIMSILMIAVMHSMAPLLDTHNLLNQEIMLSCNAVTNTGVSLFILISGYFGIRFKTHKLLSVIGIVLFYSILSFATDRWMLHLSIAPKDYIPYFLPLLCKKYWFITCYVVIYCLSPWLNRISESLSRADYRKLLAVLLFFFWLAPTVVIFHEIMDDNGKGLVNLIGLYLIGRYIRQNGFPKRITQHPWTITLSCIIVIIILNTALSFALNSVNMRFCRDNSIFIIAESIAIFYLFTRVHFRSTVVNYLAGFAFPLYLINRSVYNVINHYMPMDVDRLGVWYGICISIIVAVVCCFVVETARRIVFGHIPLEKMIQRYRH